MEYLKVMLLKIGFEDVITYIQSGNVVFKSSETSPALLEERIKKAIFKTFGFEVPVLITSKRNLLAILNRNPFTDKEDLEANRVYYVLLKSKPQAAIIDNLEQNMYPNELFKITDNCVYLNCLKGAGKAKLNNNVIEQKLLVTATTRNHRTLLKLVELS